MLTSFMQITSLKMAFMGQNVWEEEQKLKKKWFHVQLVGWNTEYSVYCTEYG